MSIVLPRRNKKNIDIFAPRKSIQDAKAKLGYAYFDPSLLECSRNAVELTKLVTIWEEIDKEKTKLARGIDREQRLLRQTLKRNYTSDDKDKHKTEKIASREGIETVDGKVVPPGFRFKANGEIKPSSLALPLVTLDEGYEKEFGPSTSSDAARHMNSTDYASVDYTKEIDDLQEVIESLCTELAKSKLNISEQKAEKVKTYLRAHANDYVSASRFIKHDEENGANPNSRFHFQPGSSVKSELHKRRLNTPSTRVCCGCQVKLKQESDDLMKVRKERETTNVLKRRWSYVPRGTYVQSTTSLASGTSIAPSSILLAASESTVPERRAVSHCVVGCRREMDGIEMRDSSKSHTVRFESDDTDENRLTKETRQRSKSSIHRPTRSAPSISRRASSGHANIGASLSNRQLKSRSSTTGREGIESALSGRSSLASGRLSSRILLDFNSRINMLKEIQAEEDQLCDEKVKNFLQKFETKPKRWR